MWGGWGVVGGEVMVCGVEGGTGMFVEGRILNGGMVCVVCEMLFRAEDVDCGRLFGLFLWERDGGCYISRE